MMRWHSFLVKGIIADCCISVYILAAMAVGTAGQCV